LAVRKLSALVRSAARVHRISSRVRDDRDTPLKWDETAMDMPVIWVGREAEIFFSMGLDSPNHTKSSPSGAVFYGRKMGGAKRYPSNKSADRMGFAKGSTRPTPAVVALMPHRGDGVGDCDGAAGHVGVQPLHHPAVEPDRAA
jgi:hypothetical protein